MAPTELTNSFYTPKKPGSEPHGQGKSKHAENCRIKAAIKADEFVKASTATATATACLQSEKSTIPHKIPCGTRSLAPSALNFLVTTISETQLIQPKSTAGALTPVKNFTPLTSGAPLSPTADAPEALSDLNSGGSRGQKFKKKSHKYGKGWITMSSAHEGALDSSESKFPNAPCQPEYSTFSKPLDIKDTAMLGTTGRTIQEDDKNTINDLPGGDKNVGMPISTAGFSPTSSKPSVHKRIASGTSGSWVNVCSSEWTTQQKKTVVIPLKSPQISSMSAEFPAMPTPLSSCSPVPQVPGHITTAVTCESRWDDVATNKSPIIQRMLTPITEIVEVLADAGNGLPSAGLSADVLNETQSPAKSPQSSAKTMTLPSLYYAKVGQSPPSCRPTMSACTEADVPPQSKETPRTLVKPSPNPLVNQCLDNLFVMIRQQRQALFEGPLITLHINQIAINGIFKRAAMAVSRVLNEHITMYPESIEYRFPIDILAPEAVRYLLMSWMWEVSQDFEVFAVPMQDTFAKNVALLRAARFLGMERYTKHILTSHIDYLKTALPSYEEIAIVEHNATSDQDPLWTQMVNHLCHDRFKKLFPDPDDFSVFLEDHPRLKIAMESADEYFSNAAKKRWERNQAERRAGWHVIEEERRARWEKNETEKHERIAKEKKAVECLKRKMDAQGSSGLMMATMEEAMLLRHD